MSSTAKWKGVPLAEIMRRVQPNPEAKYVVFHCMDTDDQGTNYYESIDLIDASPPKTILPYEMNERIRRRYKIFSKAKAVTGKIKATSGSRGSDYLRDCAAALD